MIRKPSGVCLKFIFLLLLLHGVANTTLQAQSLGGTTSGSAIFCDSINSGFISLTGYSGNILFWQSSINNGTTWNTVSNQTSTQSYYHLTKTTSFRAVVKNGSYPADTSTVSKIQVHIPGIAGNISGGGSFCMTSGTGTLQLNGATGNVQYWEYSTNNGTVWNSIPNAGTTLPFSNITQNTLYRAIVQTFTSCPSDTSGKASFVISQNTVAGIVSAADTVCYGAAGDTLLLSGNTGTVVSWQTSLNNGTSWQTSSNTGSQFIYPQVTQSVWYRVLVKNGACNTETTIPVSVLLYNTNPADAGNDVTITQYETTTLNGSGNGTPHWSPGTSLDNPGIFSPQARPFTTTTYTLSLTDLHGCVTVDTVVIHVIIPVPTAITPNGDGVNDFFKVDKIDQYPHNSLQIFNRWGNMVYAESPYTNSWNGKSSNGQDLPDDVYYYVLDYGNGDKPLTSYILIKR